MAKKDQPVVDRTIPAGLKWLYEMEALHSPALLNNLYGNIYSFPYVSDAELLIDRHNRKMLIWIHFNWSTRKIFKSRKKTVTMGILDQLQELLPSFQFRIIEDRELFEKALKRVEQRMLGGRDEKPIENNDAASAQPAAPIAVESTSSEAVEGGTSSAPAGSVPSSDVEADSKKPSQIE